MTVTVQVEGQQEAQDFKALAQTVANLCDELRHAQTIADVAIAAGATLEVLSQLLS